MKLTPDQKSRIKILSVLSFLLLIIPFFLHSRLNAFHSHLLLETDDSTYYLPSEQWLEPLSLGYREASAGLIWTRCLVYFGEQHEVRGHFQYLEDYLVGVTHLDPYFYRAYTWGSMSAIYNGTAIDRESVDMSIRMLERGLQVFPDDGDLHYFLGFQYYFELAPITTGSERSRARRNGIDEICTGALLGGGPAYLPLVCSSLAQRQGLGGIAQELLLQTLYETEDEITRSRIEQRLEEMMDPDAAYRYMRQINEHRLRWNQELPYVPHAFYLLAGPCPTFPTEDQLNMPLPMDAMIAAEEQELLYSAEEEELESDHSDLSGQDSTGLYGIPGL